MADSHSITDLITRHQQDLNFSRLTEIRPGSLSAETTKTYWIGEYTPGHPHPIEIISPQQFPLFKRELTTSTFLHNGIDDATTPRLLIFCEDQNCAPEMLFQLQKLGIAAVRTPLNAKIILRKLAYSLVQDNLQQTQHGVMLSILNHGVFLRGDSGTGKSAIALELIARGHSLVCDDAPLLHRLPALQQVYALCPPLLADLLEVRALGILNVCKLFGPTASAGLMPVQLVIELIDSFIPTVEQRLHPFTARTSILGVDIPLTYLPVHHTANLALLVETVTKNHILYNKGYDAGAILMQQQRQLLHRQSV